MLCMYCHLEYTCCKKKEHRMIPQIMNVIFLCWKAEIEASVDQWLLLF